MPSGWDPTSAVDDLPLRAQVVGDDSRVLVILVGELDHLTAPVVVEALRRARATGGSDVAVDLERLSFCDAAGVGCFLDAADQLREDARMLRLLRPTPKVRRVLRILGAEFLVD